MAKLPPSAALLLLALPVPACTQRPPPEERSVAPALAAALGVETRPETGFRPVGEDVTDLARAQNARGQEPPLPTRKGSLSRSAPRPRITRTSTGYVARLPGAHEVPTPAYHAGRIFVGGYGNYLLHAMEAETGRSSWSVRLSDDGPTDPACEDGVCVFNTYSCTLFAVEAETGRYLWSWYLGSPQLATVVLAGGAVYSSYPDSSGPPEARYVIAKFDVKTGAPGWRRRIDAEVHSTPVLHDGRVLLATKAGTLYEIDAASGDILSAFRNRIASPPVLAAEGVVFARDEIVHDNDLIATSTPVFPELEALPRQERPVVAKPRPLIVDRRLVTVDEGVIVATHLETGERLWERRLGGEMPAAISAPMLHAGESLLVATQRGDVVRMDADSGEVTSAYPLGIGELASPPIAVEGWLFAGNKSGSMVAYDTGDSSLSGWEMLGGSPDRQGTRSTEGT